MENKEIKESLLKVTLAHNALVADLHDLLNDKNK